MDHSQGIIITSEDQIHREINKLDSTNKRQEQNIRTLETKAIQNVNLYFIFQAVVLASTVAATCRHWWVLFSLSLLAAATNLMGLIDTMSKVLRYGEELDQSLSDLAFMKLYPITRDELNRVLPGSLLTHQGQEIVRPKACPLSRWKRRFAVCLYVGLFVGFSGVVMYGCRVMLCHPGDRKCIKVC